MIADTAVLSTSPWSGDQMLFPKEHYRLSESPDLDVLDMDIASLEAELERESNQSRGEMSGVQLRLGSSTSCGTSLAGSECSDEICLDVESDVEPLFPVDEDQEYLTSSLLNLLGGNPITDAAFNFPGSLEGMQVPLDMPDLSSLSNLVDLPMDSPNVAQYDSIPSVSAPCSPQPLRKRHNRRQSSSRERRSSSSCSPSECQQQPHLHRPTQQSITCNNSKPWSRLTGKQQVAVIEDLTKIISNEMGLREQMEVIRIINPVASISSNDTEFVIDLDCLNDEKLQKLQDVVRQHKAMSTTATVGSCSSSSSGVSDCSVESTSKSHRRQTKRQQKARQRENRQRQRKEYRQMLKERRSGLFQQEEVLSLTSTATAVEDEDIDIL